MSEDAEKETTSRPDEEILARRDAALAQVIQYGDPILRSRASEVRDFGDALHSEVERMVAIMRDGLGVGLAATQVGILRRLLVFQAGPDAGPAAVVNPEVEWLSEDIVEAEEGCLSIPRVSVDVERPLFARVVGVDIEGSPITLEASGLEARVLQHEMDHLDGVLILDRTTREQRKGALRALREGGAYRPGEAEEAEDGESADGAVAARSEAATEA